MPFFFDNHPRVAYDVLKNGISFDVQNPLVRARIIPILKKKGVLFYTHDVVDGQTPQFIAKRYYGDASLDWVLYITNNIIDPYFDWVMDQTTFDLYVTKKYGSIANALATIHHYEKIISPQVITSFLISPEKFVEIDETTYNTLSDSERRAIDCYAYEDNVNNKKRTIKILHKDFVNQVVVEMRAIFNEQ